MVAAEGRMVVDELFDDGVGQQLPVVQTHVRGICDAL
jgi:hypothetical protein